MNKQQDQIFGSSAVSIIFPCIGTKQGIPSFIYNNTNHTHTHTHAHTYIYIYIYKKTKQSNNNYSRNKQNLRKKETPIESLISEFVSLQYLDPTK
jgi:hypothetical protein